MKTPFYKKHTIDSLAVLLLFAMYVLFLLFLLLFGAASYQASLKSQEKNNNLYTAASYITTKFRQHDQKDSISLIEFQGIQALCFQEEINGKNYSTYIYFYDNHLKELFTATDSGADLSMGTSLAELHSFTVENPEDSFYKITLTDTNDQTSSFYLHAGVPSETAPTL